MPRTSFASSALCHARAGTDRQGQAHRPGPRRCARGPRRGSHPDRKRLPSPAENAGGGAEGPPPPPPPLRSEIGYRGQPIALVLGETLEAAIEGAETVEARYSEQRFASKIDSPSCAARAGRGEESGKRRSSIRHGADQDRPVLRLADAAPQSDRDARDQRDLRKWPPHHLRVHAASAGVRGAVAATLRLDPERIDVKSPSVGGGFGQKTRAYGHSALVRARRSSPTAPSSSSCPAARSSIRRRSGPKAIIVSAWGPTVRAR